MKVPDVEHALLTLLDPAFLGQRLTLRTVPIAARVIRRMLVSARFASVHVPSEHGRAALRNIRQYSLLGAREFVCLLELGAMRPYDVRNVKVR